MTAHRSILVRHAQPEIDPERSATDWSLSESGRLAARELAFAIGSLAPGTVVTSPERKAVETGAEIAAMLDLGLTIDDDLREQGLMSLPFLSDAEFHEAVERHFREPERVVLGNESSAAAGRRLGRALNRLERSAVDVHGMPVIVTHGRVLASFLAQLTGDDAITIWRSLRMPDAFVADLTRGASRLILPRDGEL
ncbi:MAG: histidine phosphatase family protein [Thermomicrobiales bacterium]